jgi:hypothetical protein
MPGIATIRQRIADALNRTDLDNFIETWLETAHQDIQGLQDWRAQETDYGVVSTGVTTSLTIPANAGTVKSPITLIRVAGTTVSVALAPTRFYRLASLQDILMARYQSNDLLTGTVSAEVLEPLANYRASTNTIELFPTNNVFDDHFRFLYHKILDFPNLELDGSDWFTNNAFDYLIYSSLLQAIPVLGGNDDRIQAWTEMRDKALQRTVARDVDIRYGGASLIMRG